MAHRLKVLLAKYSDEIKQLRGALKPFADRAIQYESTHEFLKAAPDAAEIGLGHLTVGDIRRAARAYKDT